MIVNQKKIILIVSYKNEEQSFNINIKLVNKRETEKKNLNSILEIDKISEEKYIDDKSRQGQHLLDYIRSATEDIFIYLWSKVTRDF